MTSSPTQRTKVFISYSHKDIKYLNELLEYLEFYRRNGLIDNWSDKRIGDGSLWRAEIKSAIDSAAVAVLLLSPSFWASRFIAENELPPLLAAAEKEGVKILSVVLREFPAEDMVIAKFQMVNSPSQPLVGMSRRDKDAVWNRVVRDIKQAFPAQQSAGQQTQTAVDAAAAPQSMISPAREQEYRQAVLNDPRINKMQIVPKNMDISGRHIFCLI